MNGLAISSEEEKDSFLVKQKVYDNLLLPILTAAVDNRTSIRFPGWMICWRLLISCQLVTIRLNR